MSGLLALSKLSENTCRHQVIASNMTKCLMHAWNIVGGVSCVYSPYSR